MNHDNDMNAGHPDYDDSPEMKAWTVEQMRQQLVRLSKEFERLKAEEQLKNAVKVPRPSQTTTPPRKVRRHHGN